MSEGRSRIRPWLPALLLWAGPAVAFAILLVVTLIVESASTSSAPVAQVVVGERVRDLRTSVVATVDRGPEVHAVAGTSGIVTAVSVAPGGEVADGTTLVAINGISVLAQVGGVPLYRPLTRGDSGPDVTELQAYLAGINIGSPATTGTFDRATVDAVKALQKSLGLAPDGVFLPQYVAYIPDSPTPIDSVAVRVGDSVASGATLITFRRAVTAIAFAAADQGRTLAAFDGSAIVVSGGSREVALASSSPSSDELPALAELLSAGLADGSLTTDGSGDRQSVRGLQISLASPVRVGSVPGEAVYATPAGPACVFLVRESGSPEAVRVDASLAVGSEIGIAYVDESLIGETVVAYPPRLSHDVRDQCG